MKRVAIFAAAGEDVEAGRKFYERQGDGLGDYFVRCILEDLRRLEIQHGAHPIHFGFMRMLSHRFPFGIYYREEKKGSRCLQFLICDVILSG